MKKSKQTNLWMRRLAILGLLVVIMLPAGSVQSYSADELMRWTGDREPETLHALMQQVDPGDTDPDDNYEGTPLIVPARPEQNAPVGDPPDDNSGGAPSSIPGLSDQVVPVQEPPDDNYGGISSPVPLPQKPKDPGQNPPDNNLDP